MRAPKKKKPKPKPKPRRKPPNPIDRDLALMNYIRDGHAGPEMRLQFLTEAVKQFPDAQWLEIERQCAEVAMNMHQQLEAIAAKYGVQ